MTEIILRPAELREAADIRAMVIGAGLNPFGLDWQRFVVAVKSDGKVIGCVQHKPHGDGSLELASLVVSPQYRDQGIGSLLVSDFLQRHEPPVHLMCQAGLTDFYNRFGFTGLPRSDLPPYFRRIQWLASALSTLTRTPDRLRIMVWTGREG